MSLHRLKQFREQIDKSLAAFMTRIKSEYHLHLVDPILYESIREFILRKGKRIRPILLILSYKGYRKGSQRMSPSIYYVSTCVELLHNFMLIHDDIIDRSDLRRGKPTMHKLLAKAVRSSERDKLGQDLGIVAGDIVYASAFDAFLSINEDLHRKEKALKYFIQTAVLTAMGEFIDTLHAEQPITQVKEKDVFLNYTLKTARYTFDCPLVVGAILAGAQQQDVRRLSELGLLIGQAFQIQDDVIGIFDTQKNIGKSILSDIAESKKTLLVCHTNMILTGTQQKKFLRCFTKPKKTYQDLITIRRIFTESGSLLYCMTQIHHRLIKTQELIRALKMKTEYRLMLELCLGQLFDHSHLIAEKFNIPIRINPFKQ